MKFKRKLALWLGIYVPFTVGKCKLEFSPAVAGPILRICSTIYKPTNTGPYNELNWDIKIGAVVLFRRAILSFRLYRA